MTFKELLGPNKFARGMIRYLDSYPGDINARIVIPVTFNDSVPTLALVDTGATWCILRPQEAASLAINYETTELEKRHIGGGSHSGRYCTLKVSIEAEHGFGAGISLEARVFVPELIPGQEPLPNLLGLSGFLERIRFAVDPEHNHFYFAALGDNDF